MPSSIFPDRHRATHYRMGRNLNPTIEPVNGQVLMAGSAWTARGLSTASLRLALNRSTPGAAPK